jgi:hypothetical protein
MSWIIAFVGFAALVILHEFGHFAAAKAVGMRVEKFSLFFGPMLAKFTRGETTYGIGPIPLGGYVKITGMNPAEGHPARARPPRLLPPARLEADRGDRGGPAGQHRPGLPDPLGDLLVDRDHRGHADGEGGLAGHARGGRAQAGGHARGGRRPGR